MKPHKLLTLTAAIHGLLVGGVDTAAARSHRITSQDAQIEMLEQRLSALEQKLAESEARNQQLAASSKTASEAPSVKTLDQKLKIIERKLEVNREILADTAKKTPKLEAGPEGFRLSSANGDHVLRLRAAVQTDANFYMDDNAKPFETRSAAKPTASTCPTCSSSSRPACGWKAACSSTSISRSCPISAGTARRCCRTPMSMPITSRTRA